MSVVLFFFFKQKTAYEMALVTGVQTCALPICIPVPEREFEPDAVTLEEEALERARAQVAARWGATLAVGGENLRIEQDPAQYPGGPHPDEAGTENGRASCRERGCQYV